ncbi:hypothetical protein D3C87_94950 [compost metagenome]
MTPGTITIFKQNVQTDTVYFSVSFLDEIEIPELQKLVHLTNLKHLNLSSLDLRDEHLEIIGEITSLELLDLDLNEISDQGLRFLEPLKNLKQLRLKDNPQLTDGCIDQLVRIPSLEMLHAGNTSITISGLSRLLDRVQLKILILDYEFADLLEELKGLSNAHPSLEITVKGKASILNGRMNS